jgi:PIN domain nuclease of toxin-antitoxin system
VLIFLAEGQPLSPDILETFVSALGSDSAYVSAGSALELGRLCASGKISIGRAPLDYFEDFTSQAGIRVADLKPEILVASSYLPGRIHKDPMDRIFIATARAMNLTLVTRDKTILAYGKEGHVKTLAC